MCPHKYADFCGNNDALAAFAASVIIGEVDGLSVLAFHDY